MKFSVSPINGQNYQFNNKSDEDLDKFLNSNKGKKVIVVQGLGFVGSVMSLVCTDSESDYAVIGLDLASEECYWKVDVQRRHASY